MTVNDSVVSNLRVDLRNQLECVHRGFDEERHKAELGLVLLHKLVLVGFRSPITALMSTSLKVVSSAAVC